MKRVLLYTWGVFLAALAGFATMVGIAMVFAYVDNRVIYFLRILAPEKLSPSPLRDLISYDTATIGQARILALAVAVWMFERWRQRQSQIQQKGGNNP